MNPEKQAEELLPCDGFECPPEKHWPLCPANFRPAVAAALRERDEIHDKINSDMDIILSEKNLELHHWRQEAEYHREQDRQHNAECIRLGERIAALEKELETERMRLAACGVAALGYFNGCADEYKSASLDDTLRLQAEKERLREALEKVPHLWTENGEPRWGEGHGEAFIEIDQKNCVRLGGRCAALAGRKP